MKNAWTVGFLGFFAGLAARTQAPQQTELVLVDGQGRPRIKLVAEPAPRLSLLAEDGSEVVALGLARESEFSGADEGEAFLALRSGHNQVVTGFTRIGDSEQGVALQMGTAKYDADRSEVVGMFAGLNVDTDRAWLSFVDVEPFPVPRLVLQTGEKATSLDIRDAEGEVVFSEKK